MTEQEGWITEADRITIKSEGLDNQVFWLIAYLSISFQGYYNSLYCGLGGFKLDTIPLVPPIAIFLVGSGGVMLQCIKLLVRGDCNE